MSTQNSSSSSWWKSRRSRLPATWQILALLVLFVSFTPVICLFKVREWLVPSVVLLATTPAAIFYMRLKWRKWSAKKTEVEVANWYYGYLAALMTPFVVAVMLLGFYAADANDWIILNWAKQRFSTLAPVVCVNRTSKLGITGPSPEQTSVDVQEISSVGIVCPDALPLTHGFNVKSVWVELVSDGAYRSLGSADGDEITFSPPLVFLPGDRLEVHLVGGEHTYYKQNFQLDYAINRKWGSYASIVRYLSDPQPGFDPVDWARLQSVGFVVQDTGRNINGATDALYGDYYDSTISGQVFF